MGKDHSFSANPAERYHREQRKKELKKNKIQRLRQRDERVITKETSTSVKEAINALERKRDTNRQGYLDTSDIRKLERLHKELKLVQKAEEEEKVKEAAVKASLTNSSLSFNELQQKYGDPTTSYYYHATLNPYGVPPPGKPMVWHCKYGGTTMDIRLAGFPQNEEQPIHATTNPASTLTYQTNESTSGSIQPHQPPPPPQQQLKSLKQPQQSRTIPPSTSHSQNHTRNVTQHKQVDASENRTNNATKQPGQQPIPMVTLQPQVVQVATSAVVPPPTTTTTTTTTVTDKKRLVTDNYLVPTLPEPSFAVRRGKKSRSLQADIWASTEELLLDGLDPTGLDNNNNETIELTTTQQPTNTTTYKRTTHTKKNFDLNDPCCPAGENYSEYRADITLADTTTSNTPVHKKKTKVKAESKTVNQQPLVDQWYYKDSSCGATQGPFTTEMMMQWTLAGYFPPNTPIRNGETGVFVPLSTIDLSVKCQNNNSTSSYDATMDSRQLLHGDEGVEARLAALREEDPRIGTSSGVVTGTLSSTSAANPETFDLSTQQHYSSKEEHNDDDDIAHCPYPIVTDTNNPEVESEDVEYPTDLYYPTYDDDDDDEPASYGQQPFENDLPAYPLHLENTTHHHVDIINVVPTQQPKAQYRGDKDVLAFMPSHLQVKRSNPPGEGKKKKTHVPTTASVANTKPANTIGTSASTSVKRQLNSSLTDDYEKFMEDINLLK